MSWRNVRLIFLREVRDQLRDRRTLFMIAVLPMLLYPALGIGVVQMMLLFSEQTRTVVVLGAEHLPDAPPLLKGNRFDSDWFEKGDEAQKLEVVTDLPRTDGHADPDEEARVDRLLAQAEPLREPVRRRQEIRERIARAEQSKKKLAEDRTAEEQARLRAEQQDNVAEAAGRRSTIQRLDREIAELKRTLDERQQELGRIEERISELFEQTGIPVLIVVPEGFRRKIARVNEKLRSHTLSDDEEDYYSGPTPIANRADEKSGIAYDRVKRVLANWEQRVLEERLTYANLPQTVTNPVNADPFDAARSDQLSANVWSKVFPALLVLMAVLGAFHPAVDLAAGEKERGTMETLLICPASRTEIVLGKFLTVMCFSMSTAVLNLASIGLTGKYMASPSGSGALSRVGDLTFPGLGALGWVLVLLVPLAALFSSVCLALATFARSSKEGQYYLTPLLLITLGLTVFCLMPGVEITPFYSIMPIIGPALLLRELLASSGGSGALLYAIPVLATSVGYSLLGLWWAIEQFAREDVLFREAERFDLGLWVRHVLRDKETTPSFTEAGFCFVIITLMQFGSIRFFQGAVDLTVPDGGKGLMQVLLTQQLVIVATPALLMGAMLTTSMVRTFRLRLPSISMLAVAAALPFVLHPLSVELQARLASWFFGGISEGTDISEEISRVLQAMRDGEQPLWLVLLAFAVAPAICEEVAFRGFILSGFSRSQRTWLAIVLSSLTFGIMHFIPQQVFNAALLGIVLGLIAVRSGSLLPAIVFHFLFNSLGVFHGRWSSAVGRLTDGPLGWFVQVEQETIRYLWPTLVLAAAGAIVLLRWLVNAPGPKSDSGRPSATPTDPAPRTVTAGEPPVGVR